MTHVLAARSRQIHSLRTEAFVPSPRNDADVALGGGPHTGSSQDDGVVVA